MPMSPSTAPLAKYRSCQPSRSTSSHATPPPITSGSRKRPGTRSSKKRNSIPSAVAASENTGSTPSRISFSTMTGGAGAKLRVPEEVGGEPPDAAVSDCSPLRVADPESGSAPPQPQMAKNSKWSKRMRSIRNRFMPAGTQSWNTGERAKKKPECPATLRPESITGHWRNLSTRQSPVHHYEHQGEPRSHSRCSR